MSEGDELAEFPAGIDLGATDWTVEADDDRVVESLTDRFGAPTATTSAGVRWESTRWFGVYRTAVAFDRDGAVAYRTTMAWWATGALFLVSLVAAAYQWVPGLSTPWSTPTDPQVAVLTLLATVTVTLALGRLFRGPTLDPESLGVQVSRTGIAFTWLRDLLFVLAAGTLGATIGAGTDHTGVTLAGAVVFGLLVLLARYAGDAGWLLLYDRDPSDGWLPLTSGFTGQFKVGLVAALPPLLAIFTWFVTGVFVDDVPSRTLVALAILPTAVTTGYCLLCLRVYRSYEGRRLDSNVTTGGRLFLLAGLLVINSVTVLLLMAVSTTVAASFAPSLLYREISLVPTGILLGGGAAVGCLGFAALTNLGRVELRQRMSESRAATAARYALTGVSILTLAALFGLLSNVVGVTVTALAFGNDALVDATPQTIRTTWESYLRYASILPGWGYGLFRGLVSTVEWLPIVFLATVWGAAVDRRIAHRLRLSRAPRRAFDADALADEPTVTVVPGTTAYATGGLLTRSRIVIGDRLFDALTEDQLAAIVAHERHHLEHRDALTASLAAVAGVVLGGANVLLAFVDLARREHEADLSACRTVSGDDLRDAVVQLRLLSDDDRSNGAPGFVLGGDFALGATTTESVTGHAEQTTADGRVERLLARYQEALRAPQELLFGDLFFEIAHPTLDVRLRHIDLRERATADVAAASMYRVTYPQERTVTTPVPRELLLERLTGEDVDRSFAAAVVDSLVADGELIETEHGLLPATGGDNAPA